VYTVLTVPHPNLAADRERPQDQGQRAAQNADALE